MIVAQDVPPPITCSVLGESRGRGMLFRGRVLSREAVSGTYRMVVVKAGPSGRSQVAQAGGFAAAAGAETFVGSATVGIEPGAGFDVRLSIEAAGRRYDCEPLTGDKT